MQETDPEGPRLPRWELELSKEQWQAWNLSSLGRYSIRRTSDKGQFFRITKEGNIYNEKELDREVYPWYNLTVEAKELDSSGECSHVPGNLGVSPFPHSFKIGCIVYHCGSPEV